MKFELYKDVVLARDLPEHRLKRGDIVKLVEHHLGPNGTEGYSAEVFNALGETLTVITVPDSALEPLREDEVLCARVLYDDTMKYPNDLAEVVAKRWSDFNPFASSPPTAPVSTAPGRHIILRPAESALPQADFLRELMGTLYHVSFLTEESRNVAVRVSYLTPEDFETKGPDDQLIHDPLLAFSTPRPFTVSEVMRLAPALDPTRSVLLVCPSKVLQPDSGCSLAVWGIMHLGEDWWRLTSGRGSSALVPPRCLTLSTFAPGTLTATVAGRVIARLEGGHIPSAPCQSLMAGPVGRFLQTGAHKLYQHTVERLGLQKFSEKPDEESLPARRFYQVFHNILRFAAEHRHGAAFAIFPDETTAADTRLAARIKMKYAVESSRIWSELVDECVAYRRYFDLVSKRDKASVAELRELGTWKGIWEEKQRSLTGLESFVASLSGVDGVVVLSTGCKLLGFGGEIVVPDDGLTEVKRAEDANATRFTLVEASTYGTRHRSAFRLCSSFEDCVVLLVSQDGEAKAVKKVGQDVVLWPDVDQQPFAL